MLYLVAVTQYLISKLAQFSRVFFPVKASALVKAWMKENKNELLNMWETQEFKKLNPLT